MPAPVPGTPAYYRSRALPVPPKPPPGGFGSVAKAIKTAVGRPGAQLVARNTPQGSLTRIETPAQIEARVRKLADESFNRQQGVLQGEAERLKKEAEGRRVMLQNAYQTVAQMNAGFGANVQGGWNQAAQTIQGMAGTGTGAVAEGLQQDTATLGQALSRVGAGGTGFDARSQAGVEAYRGGTLPGEFFAREGASGNQWMNQDAAALAQRGWQEGLSTENEARAKIEGDYNEQLAKLQTGRSDYETDLRKQLLGARGDQLELMAKNKETADKRVYDALKQQRDLKYKYWDARNRAVTAAQKQQVEMIYKYAALEETKNVNAALIAQRQASAGLSTEKTNVLKQYPGGAPKTPSASAISTATDRANKAGGAILKTSLQNLWANTPGAAMPRSFATDYLKAHPKAKTDEIQGAYKETPAYKAAVAQNQRMRSAAFGTVNAKVFRALKHSLKGFNLTDAQIRVMAYELLTNGGMTPPATWKAPPGFPDPAGGAAGIPANVFAPGINLNPGQRPGFGA